MMFKWVTNKDVVLGLLTVPDYVGQLLNSRGFVRFHTPEAHRAFDRLDLTNAAVQTVSMATISTFRRPGSQPSPADVFVSGITPEEIETMPGFGFAPSAAYMRSLLEGG